METSIAARKAEGLATVNILNSDTNSRVDAQTILSMKLSKLLLKLFLSLNIFKNSWRFSSHGSSLRVCLPSTYWENFSSFTH